MNFTELVRTKRSAHAAFLGAAALVLGVAEKNLAIAGNADCDNAYNSCMANAGNNLILQEGCGISNGWCECRSQHSIAYCACFG